MLSRWRYYFIFAIAFAATLEARFAFACPWHALSNQDTVDKLGDSANGQRVLVIQQVNRMTGEETSIRGTFQKILLPEHYGFACTIEPKGKEIDQAYVLTCERQGIQTVTERACKGSDARAIKTWDGFDRMGINILSVLLVCVPPESIPANM